MHEIFGTKPWVAPIATAGSSGSSINEDTNEDTENDDSTKPGTLL